MIAQAAISTAERIRNRVAGVDIRGRRITISIGVSTFSSHGDEADDLVRSADAALYEAKEMGKNRVVLAAMTDKPPDLFDAVASD